MVLPHVAEIRAYLESEKPMLPNAVVVAFEPTVRFEPFPGAELPPGVPTAPGVLVIPCRLRPVRRWTEGHWEFGPGVVRTWNEVQNTPKDIQVLANDLLVQYKARVWNRATLGSER